MSLRRRQRKERVQDNGGGHFRLTEREREKERRNEVMWRIEAMDGDHSKTEDMLEFGWNYSWA